MIRTLIAILLVVILLVISTTAFGLTLETTNLSGGDDDVVITDNTAPPQTIKTYHMPKGASFMNNQFMWTPSDRQAGMYEISFSTYDPSTQDDVFKTIRILVADTSFEIEAGKTFERLFTSYDPDGDKVEITATGLPQGATFTGSQFNPKLFSWTPDRRLAGRFAFTITATDYPDEGEPKTDASIIIIKVVKKLTDGGSARHTDSSETKELALRKQTKSQS